MARIKDFFFRVFSLGCPDSSRRSATERQKAGTGAVLVLFSEQAPPVQNTAKTRFNLRLKIL
jgi:hypothetical protein